MEIKGNMLDGVGHLSLTYRPEYEWRLDIVIATYIQEGAKPKISFSY